MVLSYSAIQSEFLHMIDDVKFLSLDESDANAFMTDWLKSALSNIRVQNLFSSMSYDSEIQQLTFEMKDPSDNEQADIDFVTSILATGMMIAWLQPKVTTTLNIHQMLGGKEEKLGFLPLVRHVRKRHGVFLRICWNVLRVAMPKRKDEICLYGMA